MSLRGKPTEAAWKMDVLSRVDPSRTALLVIDIQNDFCSDDGAVAAMGGDISECRMVANRIAEFVPQVSGRLGFTAFFRLIYDDQWLSESQKERLLKNGSPIICAAGSHGADLFLTPGPEDLVFTKHCYSAFSNEAFCQVLRERSIATVVVTGVDTHICIEGTVRAGYDLGYRMVVLTDLVGTTRSNISNHQNSLVLCERYLAVTVQSDLFLQELQNRKANSA